jgi:chemotaxis protein methyltransferase CheR
MKLSPDDISRLCLLVDDLSGIQWDASKAYLIETRLVPLLATFGIPSFSDLISKVRAGIDIKLRTAFIDAITTRETLFFRDDSPFQALEFKALPEIIDAKAATPFSRRLRFWSAACSSGQEPYSLAILLREMIDDLDRWDVQILATDLAPAALATASVGVYSEFEVSRGMSPKLRDKYFRKTAEGWQVSDSVKKLVKFERRNLLEPFGTLGPFDVLFCRNVAIYFDLETRKDLFERLAKTLAPHGALFAGSSENLSGYGERFKPQFHCRATFYQPNKLVTQPTATPTKPGLPALATSHLTPPQTTKLVATSPAATNPSPATPITAKVPSKPSSLLNPLLATSAR